MSLLGGACKCLLAPLRLQAPPSTLDDSLPSALTTEHARSLPSVLTTKHAHYQACSLPSVLLEAWQRCWEVLGGASIALGGDWRCLQPAPQRRLQGPPSTSDEPPWRHLQMPPSATEAPSSTSQQLGGETKCLPAPLRHLQAPPSDLEAKPSASQRLRGTFNHLPAPQRRLQATPSTSKAPPSALEAPPSEHAHYQSCSLPIVLSAQ